MDMRPYSCPACGQGVEVQEAQREYGRFFVVQSREFYCSHCGKSFTKEEMKRFEKSVP